MRENHAICVRVGNPARHWYSDVGCDSWLRVKTISAADSESGRCQFIIVFVFVYHNNEIASAVIVQRSKFVGILSVFHCLLNFAWSA